MFTIFKCDPLFCRLDTGSKYLQTNECMQVGVHYQGVYYEFAPWNGVVSWEIAQWGHWYIYADSETHKVIMELQTFVPDMHRNFF